MNALTRVAYDGPGVGYKFPPSYRFYSPAGGIEASGCFKAIDTPAEGAGPSLERDVQQAFVEAQAAGLNNPVLVGVIPFDKQQPSSLFIPRHVSHLPPASPPTAICGFACGAARQCTEQPDQAGFQQAVTRALAALTRKLTQSATRYFAADVRELLLAALTRALGELGLGEQHWIMLEGHGREAIDPALDVSRTVGWFTSMFPVAVRNQADLSALVRHAAEQLRQVPDKGIGYLPLRSNPAHRDSLPLPPVALNYLGVYQSGAGDWQALPVPPGNPSGAGNLSAELISLHGGIFDGLLTLRQIGSLREDLSARLPALMHDNLQALAALAEDER